jgi:hypothetical protein
MDQQNKIKAYWPILPIILVALAFLAYRLSIRDWDPVGLAEIGTRFQTGDPSGTEGYDGQFAYYIALQPDPQAVSPLLDVPAYRYQRILLPIASRALALGKPALIPWTLIIINFLSHIIGSWMLVSYLIYAGTPTRYALIHGLWIGLVLGIGADLFEPLAFALVVAAWFARQKHRWKLGYFFLVLALFAKEITLVFWVAALLEDIARPKRRAIAVSPGVIFAIWQAWLWGTFGAPGIGSGGAMATGFEVIPYAGMFRIATASVEVFLLFVLIFGPTIVLPSLLGIIGAARTIFRQQRGSSEWALLLNSLMIAFLPFSTFREPLGLVRLATGMVTSVIFFSAEHNQRRPLNYAMFWISFLVILVA